MNKEELEQVKIKSEERERKLLKIMRDRGLLGPNEEYHDDMIDCFRYGYDKLLKNKG